MKLDAGKLHVQFVRRTEASARAIERASSDPTIATIQLFLLNSIARRQRTGS